ncbi:MAG: glycosyl transferase family 2 [Actinomycetia bacterium]|nr:glycosyl transferase family 2 [Actinomycetes bacterium]
MNVRPSVSVVICCYTEDRWDDLTAAISSVRMQTVPAYEVIVAVDHAPELLRRVRETFLDVTIVENNAARGLSGARNAGIAAARGDVVAFLDDDAVAVADWLEHLCEPYRSPSVVAVGGRVVPRWDDARPAWFPPEFDWVVGCTYAGHPGEGPVRNVIGANMSFRRSVFTELGGFDDRIGRVAALPAGCEETELCIRVRQRRPGSVVWYTPSAIVFHRVRAERTTFAYFRARCLAEGASKTRVSRLVGSRDGLSSERSYTTRTLPQAALRDARVAVTDRSRSALARVAARAAGVAWAGAGFAAARVTLARTDRALPVPEEQPFRPALVTQVDMVMPGGITGDRGDTGGYYSRAIVLVRDRGRPRGVIEIEIPPEGLDATRLEQRLREAVVNQELPASAPGSPGDNARALFSMSSMFSGLPPVTVVVATRDRPEALRRCVDSILASDYPDFDVLIVDNAPDSIATQRVVSDVYGPGQRVRYVREDTPGLACAHNRALLDVHTPIVAFTDDDVVVDQDWLSQLVAGFGIAPDVGCVTGMIFPLEIETPAQELVERSVGFNKGLERRLWRLGGAGVTDPLFPYAAGKFGSGANMAFRTDVLRSMGGFDPALGTGTRARGGDDLAAFFDVVSSGHALVYEPAAVVFHAHRRDEDGLMRQAFGYGAGLTAYLTKTVVNRPRRVYEIASRVPAGVWYAFARGSEKNARLPDAYPHALVVRERVGMLAGPALYMWSRYATRHIERLPVGAVRQPVPVATAVGERGM